MISYATSRISPDLVTAARQRVTLDWFAEYSAQYHLYISTLVIGEASAGDERAAFGRLAKVRDVSRLAITESAGKLASQLVVSGILPERAGDDALHIAIAAVHGVENLLTWNFKPIANASKRNAIEKVCMDGGCEPPAICTPEELTDDAANR